MTELYICYEIDPEESIFSIHFSNHGVITMDQPTIALNVESNESDEQYLMPFDMGHLIDMRPHIPLIYPESDPVNVNDTLYKTHGKANCSTKKGGRPECVMPCLSDYLERVDELKLLMPEPFTFEDSERRPFDFLAAYKR